MIREYDPAADAIGSYYAAVEAKRLRGDTHWPGADPSPSAAGGLPAAHRALLSSPTRGEEKVAFDWPAFGAALRAQLAECNPGLRALGDQLGITASDISRASNGAPVRVEKVMALCDWMGRAERDFYSAKSACCSARHVKQGAGE